MSVDKRPLTVREQTLVMYALPVVTPCAKKMMWKAGGLLDVDALISIGNLAVSEAVRIFQDEYSHDFADFARRYARSAMRNAIGAELFQERVKRAAL
ncbi:MAG: hypothetical protein ACMG6S_35745, partial [Byssovorax sp.]